MLKVKDLAIRRGDFLLESIGFEVPAGSTLNLKGPSGCGKTTICLAIAGFVPIERGSIEICGKSVETLPPEKRETAMVFQDGALFPNLSVFENIAFALRVRKESEDVIQKEVEAWMQRLSISELATRKSFELSGGQVQRVSIARAMISAFPVLLLDEPFTGLELGLRKAIMSELKEIIQERRVSALLITHQDDDARVLSDAEFVLRQ